MTDGRQLTPKQTVTTPRVYTLAIMRMWRRELGVLPSKEQVGVVRAQYMTETGDRACFNWNLGNVKKVAGDGYDWHFLNGVWEGVTPAEFDRLRRDPTWGHLVHIDEGNAASEHKRAVGPTKISVIFDPPHPFAKFRAYPSLEDALAKKWGLLRSKHYAAAWQHVEGGDPEAFAHALGSARPPYYTASANAYAAACLRCFAEWMKLTVYDEALRELLAEMDAPTAPSLPNEADEEPGAVRFDWTSIVDEDVRDAVRDGTTVAIVDLARQAINDRHDGD